MMFGSIDSLYKYPINRINKNKKSDKHNTVEDIIENNKKVFDLSHGKGKRKKHKSKKK